MEFFFVTEKAGIKFTDNHNLSVEIFFDSPRAIDDNSISAGKIYFTTDEFLPFIQHILKQNNKEHILNFFKGREDIYPSYLASKDIWFNRDKQINLLDNKLSLALIFDLKLSFTAEFKSSLINGLKYFSEKLAEYFHEVRIDVFTVYLSEWMDIAVQAPVTNLYLIPATLDKLVSYDVILNLSDIADENNNIIRERIDSCLNALMGINERASFIEMNDNNDLVSIIIPTHNRQNLLPQTVESVLNQTYKNLEVIIVDDGSTDNTRQVAESYLSDNRVKYIYQPNQQVCAARNNGINNSSGNYLMFIDDDDHYLPYSVEKLLAFIKKQPENVKMVYGEIVHFTEELKIFMKGDKLLAKPDLFLQFLMGCNITTAGQVIANARVVREVGMFDINYQMAGDYELWTKIILKYNIAKIDIPVVFYRNHEIQATKNEGNIRYLSDKAALKFWYQIQENFNRFFNNSRQYSEVTESEKIARRLEEVAGKTIDYAFAHYDTALELLEFAQEKSFSNQRETKIKDLQVNISSLLNENFNSSLRVSEAEKESLRVSNK
jgi:glycosyltransferase involved in cell wall biosynthesis